MKAAHLASKFLTENGLLIFTGSEQVISEPCDNELTYALTKNSVCTIAENIAKNPKLPASSRIITIFPP